MAVERRKFLQLALASAAFGDAGPALALGDDAWTPRPTDLTPGKAFRHGVASGDPLEDRVILWTRITPERAAPVPFECVVATDPDLHHPVWSCRGVTGPERDFTVKLDARGLAPGQTYYYRFVARREASPIGRTRTLPRYTEKVRFALASCSNWPAGFFSAYGHLARQSDLDAVIHVGDYIYEYANGAYTDGTSIGRIPAPNKEIVALNDYRTRFAQYRTDADLQEAHRLHPWIVVWDDHEIANDAWRRGADNHDPSNGEGDWETRRRRAIRAWREWLPIRDSANPLTDPARIYRSFQFGDLVTLDMLDTRHVGRDRQIPGLVDLNTLQIVAIEGTPEQVAVETLRRIAAYSNPLRQLLGAEQERWLMQHLLEPTVKRTRWHVLGQQVMMGQLTLSNSALPPGVRIPLNPDQWDGYVGARERLLGFIRSRGVDNVIVLTGDIHSSWANDIARDPYSASYSRAKDGLAVEFVCPGISSPFFTDPDPKVTKGLECLVQSTNPHTRFVDFERNGYVVVDIDKYRARAEWHHIDNVREPQTQQTLAAAVMVDSGARYITQVEDHTGLSTQCSTAPA
jgi:alkaline phosphatase D